MLESGAQSTRSHKPLDVARYGGAHSDLVEIGHGNESWGQAFLNLEWPCIAVALGSQEHDLYEVLLAVPARGLEYKGDAFRCDLQPRLFGHFATCSCSGSLPRRRSAAG